MLFKILKLCMVKKIVHAKLQVMMIIDYEKAWRGRLDCLEEKSCVRRVKREGIGKEKAQALYCLEIFVKMLIYGIF